MSHLLVAALNAFGTSTPHTATQIRDPLDKARKISSSSSNKYETRHVDALDAWVNGKNLKKATAVWEEILKDSPDDELAAKFAHDAYFYLVNYNKYDKLFTPQPQHPQHTCSHTSCNTTSLLITHTTPHTLHTYRTPRTQHTHHNNHHHTNHTQQHTTLTTHTIVTVLVVTRN